MVLLEHGKKVAVRMQVYFCATFRSKRSRSRYLLVQLIGSLRTRCSVLDAAPAAVRRFFSLAITLSFVNIHADSSVGREDSHQSA